MVGKTKAAHQTAVANAGPGSSIGSTSAERHGRLLAAFLVAQRPRKWAHTYTTQAPRFMGNTLFPPVKDAMRERASFR